jgi:hypothetical protein
MALTVEIEQDQLRQKVVEVARQHKASWIELGEYLFSIHKNKFFKYWGYLTFEGYVGKELALRENTAMKMLRSYVYLEQKEPETVKLCHTNSDTPKKIPSYEAVNLLRLASKNKNLNPEDITSVRQVAMDGNKEPKEVRAHVKQLLSRRDDRDETEIRNSRRNSAFKRLISVLNSTKKQLESDHLLPRYLAKQISDLSEKLEAQIEL